MAPMQTEQTIDQQVGEERGGRYCGDGLPQKNSVANMRFQNSPWACQTGGFGISVKSGQDLNEAISVKTLLC